ncbi:hypothetical protein HH308_03790 [Gordonia sp. TBRC 11910]|uniref:Peptidase inhibitor family I36 n=1 Tax=Gordonia asplenii TaxID=2725283 RepID=A0A848KV33_9ACTN|nr:hypothetical protein [Gordonia asplenii]NMO00333.1 hypothetical protein [Gordonia asplenii]
MSRIRIAVAASALAVSAAAMIGSPADAAPAGRVDPGAMFSSVHYGTGCLYQMSVPVNSSGWVAFYERKAKGYPVRFIGRSRANGAMASVDWVPNRQGLRELYAVQNGKRSPITYAQVTQGYGSGGACFAWP